MEKTWVHQTLESPIDWGKIRTGDEEWPHALARLSHLVDLAAGWQMTGERPILDCYWDHVTQFCHARRETKCFLWPNRLDSALRIFHFIKSFDLLNHTNDSTEPQRQLLFDQIQFEVDFLLGGLGSKVGNWELIICCALLTAAEYLHGHVDTQGWRDKASARLQDLLKTEIQPDGHWIEQAPMYHGECIIALADYVTILKTNDLPVPDWLLKAMQSLLVTLEEITDPQGRIPQIGDSDAFETAYISHLCEVLLGDQARGDRGNDASPPLVRVYQPTGWAVSKWNDPTSGKKYQLIFDASGKPPKRRQWHSHADDLQVILTSSDGPILVDPGRFNYSSVLGPHNPTIRRMIQSSGLFRRLYGTFVSRHRELVRTDWRSYFHKTDSHNTVCLYVRDRRGYGEFEGENSRVSLRTLFADEGSNTFLLRGEIDPDENNLHSYRHVRSIIGILPNLIAIVDKCEAKSDDCWTSGFHLGGGISVSCEKDDYVLGRGDQIVCMMSNCSSADDCGTRFSDGWVSPEYNLKIPSKTVESFVFNDYAFRQITLFRFSPLSGSFGNEKVQIDLLNQSDRPFDRIRLDSGDRSLIIWHQDEPTTFTDGAFTIDTELFVHRT